MLKAHPVIKKLSTVKENENIKTFEGYVVSSTKDATRLCTSLNGDCYIDIPTKTIVHDDDVPNDKTGKVRVFVNESARIELGVQTQVALASGVWCSPRGISYCWKRTRTGDGTIIIIMEPCGSCLTDGQLSANIGDLLFAQ